MGFWQLHDSFAHPEWVKDKNMIANLNPSASAIAAHAKEQFTAPPDPGYNISVAITRDGSVTVTNSRNGFTKTYQVAR
jgi:hypothetical protein